MIGPFRRKEPPPPPKPPYVERLEALRHLLLVMAVETARSLTRPLRREPESPTRPARLRARVLLSCLLLGYLALGFRLYRLQIVEHERWSQVARKQHTRERAIPPERGRILVRDVERQVPAALSVDRGSLLVYGREHRRVERFLKKLTGALSDLTPEELRTTEERLRAGRAFYLRRRKLDRAALERLRAARLPHVEVAVEPQRAYPYRGLAAQVLGLTRDGVGSMGLERRFDPWLRGVPGRRQIHLDVLGRERVTDAAITRPAQAGLDVVLTIDRSIQAAVEDELARLGEEHQPQGAAAVVVDPRTGDILAMGSWPTYDPSALKGDFTKALVNRAIQHSYEPGSTIKPLLVGTAWQLELGAWNRPIHCPRTLKVPRRRKPIVDSHTVGDVLEADVLVQSSNTGAYLITARMSPEQIRRALSAFGLGTVSGLDLPGELTGNMRSLEKLGSPTTLGSVAQGYALTVTPLQMALAYGAIANGGTLFRPRLVSELRDRSGKVIQAIEPQARSRPLAAHVASGPLRDALTRVVSREGTARRAASKFYAVAGKTGTTKLLVDGRYHEREVVASFSGFAPAEDPRVAFCVVAWGPDTSKRRAWGGTVAAPAAGRIAERALRMMRVPPSPAEDSAK